MLFHLPPSWLVGDDPFPLGQLLLELLVGDETERLPGCDLSERVGVCALRGVDGLLLLRAGDGLSGPDGSRATDPPLGRGR